MVVAGIFFVSGTVLIRQWRVSLQLRHENRALREEIQAREQTAKNDTAAAHAKLDEEITRLRFEAQEVHKLRNEVSQLRGQRNELERQRAENQRLKSGTLSNVPSAAQPSQEQDYFANQDWTFAGYATPEAALQSSLWAMREGDLNSLQASTTADGWARIGGGMDNQSDARMAEAIKRKVKNSAGFRILERKSVTKDEIILRVHADGENAAQNIVMKRSDGEWKMERTYRDAPVPP
jgi:hypothetical protein